MSENDNCEQSRIAAGEGRREEEDWELIQL
jgi:hypothetical protein